LTANIVGATPNTAYVNASGLLTGGGQLNGNVSIALTTVPVANVTGAVPDTRLVSAGGLLTGGGNLASNVTLSLTSVPVANVPGAVPNTVNVLSGGSISGGGPLTGNVTLSLTSVPVANVPGAVPNTVNVLAGGLLSGGGALTGNVTISLANVPNANVTGLGTMAIQNSNNVTITGGSINAQAVNHTGNTSIMRNHVKLQVCLLGSCWLFVCQRQQHRRKNPLLRYLTWNFKTFLILSVEQSLSLSVGGARRYGTL